MKSLGSLLVAVTLLSQIPPTWAQTRTAQDTLRSGSPLDSTQGGIVSAADTIAPKRAVTDTAPAESAKSPALAMILSGALPGAGQIYNESYWKVPIIAGLGGYFIYEFFHNNSLYKDYRDQYSASLATVPGGDDQLLTLREFYKDQRDSFAWYFLILYAVNILDAYVDASLFDFEVSGNLSHRSLPLDCSPAWDGTRLRLAIRF